MSHAIEYAWETEEPSQGFAQRVVDDASFDRLMGAWTTHNPRAIFSLSVICHRSLGEAESLPALLAELLAKGFRRPVGRGNGTREQKQQKWGMTRASGEPKHRRENRGGGR